VAKGEHGGTSREYGGVIREHGRVMREQGRAAREHGGAEGEQMDETVVSGGAKQRHLSQRTVTCWLQFGDTIYIYIYIRTNTNT